LWEEDKILLLKITGPIMFWDIGFGQKIFHSFQKLSTQNISLWVAGFQGFLQADSSLNNKKDYLLWKWKTIWAETLPTGRIIFKISSGSPLFTFT
jgi:hypothetical protein